MDYSSGSLYYAERFYVTTHEEYLAVLSAVRVLELYLEG